MEIKPTDKQMQKINQSIGVCRWLYNAYIGKNSEVYEKDKSFMSAFDFDKYINNEVKVLDEFSWINTCGSKARKKAITNAETAFKRFFKKTSGFPKFKKKYKSEVGVYFPKNNKNDWTIERHRIKIPTLGFVRLKGYGYINPNSDITSGTITCKAGRYYVSVLCNIKPKSNNHHKQPITEPIGIDLGIKKFATLSNGKIYKNINKTITVRKLEKKLKREQRKLSRKYECFKKLNIKEKRRATRQNIRKQVLRVQKIHQRLTNIRTDYINKIVSNIIRQKPSHITIEDLNVKGMMKNKHLSKSIQKQKFYEFRVKLTDKCAINNIELRIVSRWYPSSKTCSCCGDIKKDLKLKDKVYNCEICGLSIDRDLNAGINLKNATNYHIVGLLN